MPPPTPLVARATAHVHAFRDRALRSVVSDLSRSRKTLKAFAQQQQQQKQEHGSLTASAGASQIIVSNPFLPWKNPATGHWRPPVYSLRRQKELVKSAKAAGVLDLLPPGLKHRDTGAAFRPIPRLPRRTSGPGSPTVGVSVGANDTPEDVAASVVVEPLEIAASETVPQRDVVAQPWALPVTWEGAPPAPKAVQTAAARLYAGKKRMFKGHKWQRVRAQLNAHRRNLMRDMAKRVARYKNVGFFFLSLSSGKRRELELTYTIHSTTLVVGQILSNRWQPSNNQNCLSRHWLFFMSPQRSGACMLAFTASGNRNWHGANF